MRIPFVPQMEAADCGAACLAMVLGLHGRRVPLEAARDAIGSARGGVSAFDLIEGARRFSLVGRGVRLELDEVRLLPAGSILHWAFDHFVVLEKVERRGVRVVDPAAGRRLVPWRRFGEEFTGIALTFEPGEGFRREKVADRTLATYFRRLLEHKPLMSRVAILSLMVQLLGLALPLGLGVVVDRIVPRQEVGLLTVVGAGLAVVVAFHVLAVATRAFLLIYLRAALDIRLTVGFMDHLADVPLAFFLTRPSGDLIARYESNRSLRHTLTSATLSTLLDGTLVFLYLALLLALSPGLGAVVVLLGALQVVLLLVFGGRYRERMSDELHAEARTQAHLVDMLSGIETLKAAGAETRFLDRWSHLFVAELNAGVRRNRLGSIAGAATQGLTLASPLVLLLVGAGQVLDGDLSLGTMLALNALAIGFLTPLSSLITTALSLEEARSHIARVDDVLRVPREQEPGSVAVAPALTGAIALEGVSFRYASLEAFALVDVSLSVPAGAKIAIVGRSGAGKSTLARVLVGLYPPTAGRVVFDGRDLRELDVRSVRRQIGIVTQDARIFGATIRDNITLGDPRLGPEEVARAATLAEIHDEIASLPLGYDTPLAPGGVSLSGGQRQRLAVARAVAHTPSILLLDEATSDLDTINESALMRNLAGLRCTRIVIAHRLSTVVDADLIVVLHEGRIEETGTHGGLLARGGRYAALVAGQISP